MRFLDQFWSPRVLAFFFGGLGLFALVGIGGPLVAGGGFHPVQLLYIIQGGLMVASAAFLWSSAARGWWLAWAAMLVTASSGFVLEPSMSQVGPEFMMSASAVFFCGIVHGNVYGACFPGAGPHTAFPAAPAVLLLVAPLFALLAEPQRVGLALFPIFVCLIFARWVFSPLLGLLRGNGDWRPPKQPADEDRAVA